MAAGSQREGLGEHPNREKMGAVWKYNGSSNQAETTSERMEEARRLRRLQVMMNMVMSVISQDPDLTLEEAAEMAANARCAALSMFPDKELRLRSPLPPATAAANERTLPSTVGSAKRSCSLTSLVLNRVSAVDSRSGPDKLEDSSITGAQGSSHEEIRVQ